MNTGPAIVDFERPRSGLLRRRRPNRRIAAQRHSAPPRDRHILRSLLRTSWAVSKVVVLVATLVATGWGARVAIRYVVNSPRFQLKAIEFSPTPHLERFEMLALAEVALGDRLLSVDTDAVAGKIASHPWVATARASRRLPATLVIEITERHAVAVAALSGLYLVDGSGRPFKRASMEEADGLPVLTGIGRERYAQMRDVSEAAFRDALALVGEYNKRPGRPALAEINIDPGFGFSLFLLEGGAEIRLGRGNFGKKLAQFDRILEAVLAKEAGEISSLRIVHLDLPDGGRVPVLLRETSAVKPALQSPTHLAKN